MVARHLNKSDNGSSVPETKANNHEVRPDSPLRDAKHRNSITNAAPMICQADMPQTGNRRQIISPEREQ